MAISQRFPKSFSYEGEIGENEEFRPECPVFRGPSCLSDLKDIDKTFKTRKISIALKRVNS